MTDKTAVLNALKKVKLPAGDTDVVSAGIIESVNINNDIVSITLQIDPAEAEQMEKVRRNCEEAVSALAGISKVKAIMTARKKPSQPGKSEPPKPKNLPGVRHIVAVASGKGGVGKSTTSVNLAFALSKQGLKVGLADCDVYGPSASVLLGVRTGPQFTEDDRILPIDRDGIKAISMSFLIDPDTAAIWRGPMVISAIQQFLTGVAWDVDGALDVLVVDLPPGTGDVQLTLSQTVHVSGAIIVSTPQDLALVDARKAFDMFAKTGTPIFGVVENMSFFVCPHCGEATNLFGHGGARAVASEKGLPFLGEVPLHMDIREASDAGSPIVVSKPDSIHAEIYMKIAGQVKDRLSQFSRLQ